MSEEIMKIWIVTIIFSTVSCKVARHKNILAASTNNSKMKYNEPSSPVPCTNCGSNPSESMLQVDEIDKLNLIEETMNYVENMLSIKRETTLLMPSDNEPEQLIAVTPPSAWCESTSQIVYFKDNETPDTSYYYNPPCTRIKRCGGCCPEKQHSCQPAVKTIRKFSVQKINSVTKTFVNVEKLIEEHSICQCDCLIKSNSCTEKEEYDGRRCRCNCKDSEEKRNCPNNNVKWYNYNNCTCTCGPDILRECNTGQKFDENTCSCRP